MTGTRDALVRDLLAQRESLIQACWARQHWSRTPLRTSDGRTLVVDFPGWLNRGAGPDFTGARLYVGDTLVQGDVEIHLDEADWYAHGHGGDPRYQRVVLHVVVDRASAPAAQPVSGAAIPIFDA